MNSLNTRPPRIAVIIVTRNRKDLLKRSLQSLQNNLQSIAYLLIIDNSSSDGSQAMIKKEFPNAILIENSQNLGFGRANNLGLQYMRNQNLSTDWILFINDDAYFEDNSIQTLFRSLENKTSIKAAIPAVVHEDGRFQIGIGGSDLSLKSAFAYFFGFSHLFPSFLNGFFIHQNYFYNKRIIKEIDWASGVCLAVKSDVFKQISGFDEDFFMYSEDVALGEKIRRLGKIVYYPLAKVVHSQKKHTGNSTEGINTLWLTSLFKYFQKKNNLDSFSIKLLLLKLIFLGGLSLRQIFQGLNALLGNEEAKKKSKTFKAFNRHIRKSIFKPAS